MSDKERLENMSPIGIDLNGNVLLKGKDYHWLLQQAKQRQKLLERLNKRGIEIRKLKNQLSRCRKKIKKLDWNLLVAKGAADQSMRANKSNYELANKLEDENKRLREALEQIANSDGWLIEPNPLCTVDEAYGRCVEKARQALEGEE